MKVMYFMGDQSTIPVGKLVNTFRIGRKWYDAVKAPEIVALADANTKEEFGLAVVVETHLGFWNRVREHGDRNHEFLGVKQNVSMSGLFNRLRVIYDGKDGREAFDPTNTQVSVIYLLRLDPAQAEGELEQAAAGQEPAPPAAPEPQPEPEETKDEGDDNDNGGDQGGEPSAEDALRASGGENVQTPDENDGDEHEDSAPEDDHQDDGEKSDDADDSEQH